MRWLFDNRADAGRQLAQRLRVFAGRSDVLVLALPRGGVVVGYEVAKALQAPLDVLLVRKLGVPGYEELAMGAIASGNTLVLNNEIIEGLEIPQETVTEVIAAERHELARRERVYRDGQPPPAVGGRTIVLVDDGIATGATMRAAIIALRVREPAGIVVAVPVAAAEACELMNHIAEQVVCLMTPEPFYGIGAWYRDFGQLDDAAVCALLERAARERLSIPALAA